MQYKFSLKNKNDFSQQVVKLFMTGVFCVSIYYGYGFFYNYELRRIKNSLNEIENVEVQNIWGHEDVTLEEIAARVYIKNKGELVLQNLSKDVNNYPHTVLLSEIGGFSFMKFSCKNTIEVGTMIDIGKGTFLGERIGKEFNSEKDVIENYDLILEVVQNLKQLPKLNYFKHQEEEVYLGIQHRKAIDKDPIYNLFGVEDAFEFARTLDWNNCDCKTIKKASF